MQVTTLDGYVFQSGLDRVDLIKIDAEGGRWPCSAGLDNSFEDSTSRQIIIEANPITLRAAGESNRIDYCSDLERSGHVI